MKHNCIVFSGLSEEFTDSEKGKSQNSQSSFSILSYEANIKYTTQSTNDITKIELQTPRTKEKYVLASYQKVKLRRVFLVIKWSL